MPTLPVNPDDHPIVRMVKEQEPFLPRKALAVLLVYAVQRLRLCGGDLWMHQFGQDFASFRLRLGERRAKGKEIDRWMSQALSEMERNERPARPRGGRKLLWPPRITYAKYRFALKAVEIAQKELRGQEKDPRNLARKIQSLWRTRVGEILLDTYLFPRTREEIATALERPLPDQVFEVPDDLANSREDSAGSVAKLIVSALAGVSPEHLQKVVFPKARKTRSLIPQA